MDATEPELGNADMQEMDITDIKQHPDEHDADHYNSYHIELAELPERKEMDFSNMNKEEGNDEDDNAGEEGKDNPYDIDEMKENMLETEEEAAEEQRSANPKTMSDPKIKTARPIRFNSRWMRTYSKI